MMESAAAEQRQVKGSFRMELIGAGMYERLASQYRKNRPISEKFIRFSRQEAMHSRLFNEYHRQNYGRSLGGERLWRLLGQIAALAMGPLPLQRKLRKISVIEEQAVHRIREVLSKGEEKGLYKIVRRILPDEMEHAALCEEVFPRGKDSASA